MKIILARYHDKENINTRLPDSLNRVQGVLPSLGIAYIAAFLEKHHHDVKIVDAPAANITAADFRKLILKESPDIVGVTAMISNIRGALEAARLAKECGCLTVLGGPLLPVYPEEVMSYDFIDYGIVGEGEYPMLELARALENNLSVDSIKGLAYKSRGQTCINEPYIVEDLDSLPFPARHLLPMNRYSSVIALHPVTTMIASRGCPYRCGFCIKGPSDKRFRVRDHEKVVDEMIEVVGRYGVKEIMFYDDTITVNRGFVERMCEEILKRGLKIKWECPARADTVDPRILALMKKAGCKRLRYGVESGDEGILKLMNKGIDLKKVKDAFKWTRSAGMETFAYFIIGYIHETPDTIRRTISFAEELKPDLIMFTLGTPYPDTPLFDLAVKEGYISKDYWRNFVLGTTHERLPYLVPDAEMWINRAYRSFYFRWDYVLKRIVSIRSLQDVKKHVQAAKGLFLFRMSKG